VDPTDDPDRRCLLAFDEPDRAGEHGDEGLDRVGHLGDEVPEVERRDALPPSEDRALRTGSMRSLSLWGGAGVVDEDVAVPASSLDEPIGTEAGRLLYRRVR
jgi:hypothetical protein